MFAGLLDLGFYAYALIATQNAARVAALYAASSSIAAENSAKTCQYVLEELRMMPNVGSRVTQCASSKDLISDTLPVSLAMSHLVGSGADGSDAAQVTVGYRTIPMFPLPWLPGRLTVVRSVQARVNTF